MDYENIPVQPDSEGWRFYAKASFFLAVVANSIGIWHLPTDYWVKGYVSMGLLFAIGAAFTLAKTLRDEHETKKLLNRISEAKTEKLLKEHGE